MSWVTGLMTYAIMWWLIFFMALPFGVRTADEAGVEREAGHASSAPVAPRLWLKAGITTVLAGITFGIFYFVAANDLFGFREMLLSQH
jgi:predicted secreted protein